MDDIRFMVGAKIKALRTSQRMTQEDLAEKTGIDYKYIQKIEGKNPPNVQVNTLQRIAKVLKTTPANLLK